MLSGRNPLLWDLYFIVAPFVSDLFQGVIVLGMWELIIRLKGASDSNKAHETNK